MHKDRKNKAKANPDPQCGEFAAKVSDLDDCLRDLREKAKPGTDLHLAARSIAALQVDVIASCFRLLRLIDELAFQLLMEECPFEERIRRIKCLIRLTGKIQGTILGAIDGYLDCFGGKKVIAIQAITQWIIQLRERSPAESAQVDQIMKAIIEKSTKKPRRVFARKWPATGVFFHHS